MVESFQATFLRQLRYGVSVAPRYAASSALGCTQGNRVSRLNDSAGLEDERRAEQAAACGNRKGTISENRRSWTSAIRHMVIKKRN